MSKRINNIFNVNFSSFKTLVSMLISNSQELDFKKNFKKSLINIVSKVLTFIFCITISYLFFFVCIKLSIFSLLPFIPTSVPSIIINIILFFSTINTINKVTNDLYYSQDNKVLLTLPVSKTTLFISRLFVSFINCYIRSLTLEIPFLLGYFVASRYPIYILFTTFLIFVVVDLIVVLISALLSIPLYYLKRLLIVYPILKKIISLIVLIIIIIFVSYFISLIPKNIDIFTNWSPYFYKIQDGLKYYTNKFSFLYKTSLMYLGSFNGYSVKYFSGNGIFGLYTFITFVCLVPILYFCVLILCCPFYLSLASGNEELIAKSNKKHNKIKNKNNVLTQIYKELLLFIKDDIIAPNYIIIFVSLPLILSLITKIFMAMDLNSTGLSLVQDALFLISLLISTSANSLVSKMYSLEGGAFKISRTYPLSSKFRLTSKLIVPFIIGVTSLLISFIVIANIRKELFVENLILGLSVILIYVSHLLYSASLDFLNPVETFGDVSNMSKNEKRSILLAFILSLVLSYLFYLYTKDAIVWIKSIQMTSSIKLLIIGFICLIYSIYTYIRKIKYLYEEGISE